MGADELDISDPDSDGEEERAPKQCRAGQSDRGEAAAPPPKRKQTGNRAWGRLVEARTSWTPREAYSATVGGIHRGQGG